MCFFLCFFPSEIIQTRLRLLTGEEMHQINCIALTFRMSDGHCSVREGNTSRKNALSVHIVRSQVATPEGTAVLENRIRATGSLQARAVTSLIPVLFLQGSRKFLARVSEVHNYHFLAFLMGMWHLNSSLVKAGMLLVGPWPADLLLTT